MKCIATDSSPGDIPVNKMKDGELGEITSWPDIGGNIGQIVQRHGKTLLCVGQSSRQSWEDIFDEFHPKCRIRLLRVGETIKLVE